MEKSVQKAVQPVQKPVQPVQQPEKAVEKPEKVQKQAEPVRQESLQEKPVQPVLEAEAKEKLQEESIPEPQSHSEPAQIPKKSRLSALAEKLCGIPDFFQKALGDISGCRPAVEASGGEISETFSFPVGTESEAFSLY